ncbi:release factor glutamine methyltransferase [Bacteroidia bacterium]|nr:release factor glutamine methyltransferase [Bacteroidia bacterium]
MLQYIREELSVGALPPQEVDALGYLVLQSVCQKDRHALLRDKDMQLSENQADAVKKIVAELKKNRPLQYVLGETEFYGLRLAVDENVLIPRPETEELVDLILRGCGVRGCLLDIGTGSGCIAIALAKHLPDTEVYALDISPKALEIARKNAADNRVNVHFFQHDILSPAPITSHLSPFTPHPSPATFDLIVSNPPYIVPSERTEMHPNVLDYEPHGALFVPENEPLLFYERIAAMGCKMLRPRGQLFFEINARFGQEIAALLHQKGYAEVKIIQDISKKERFIQAEWKNQ